MTRSDVVSGTEWRSRLLAPTLIALLSLLVLLAVAIPPATAQDDDDEPTWANEMTPRSGKTTPPGRWLPARTDNPLGAQQLTEEQKREIERLSTIGYLGGYREAPSVSGVTIYEPERAWNGYNLYTSGDFPGAILMDMEGNELHRWECSFLHAFPGRADILEPDRSNRWRNVHLYDNGDVLGIYEGLGIVKLDKDSNVLWSHQGGEHHDLKVAENGNIYVLSREAHIVQWISKKNPVLEDFITILDPNGNMIRRISLLSALKRSRFTNAIRTTEMERKGDIFHTNALEILDGSMEDRIPAFKKGNILTSFRRLDSIAVVNPESEEVVWMQFGMWLAQHDPTTLDSGNIMVFDNRGHGGQSKVIEYDPTSMEPVWIYSGTNEHPFFTNAGGANQRLPNGNTLITESDNGRAFEVTREGEIVWEYRNPARAGENDGLIATIFEMVRLPYDSPFDWLEAE